MKFLVIDDDRDFLEKIKSKIHDNFIDAHCDTFTSLPPDYQLRDDYTVIIVDLLLDNEYGIHVVKKLKMVYPKAFYVCISSKNELVFETQILGTLCFIRKQHFDYDFNVMKHLLCKCKGQNKELKIRLDNTFHKDSNTKVLTVNTEDIIYVESFAHKVILITLKGNFTTNISLKQFLSLTKDCGCFAQIHRSIVINLNYLYKINENKVEMAKYKNNQHILEIGRKYKDEFEKSFERFLLL